MTASNLTACGKEFIAWRRNGKQQEVKRGTEQERGGKKVKKEGEERG